MSAGRNVAATVALTGAAVGWALVYRAAAKAAQSRDIETALKGEAAQLAIPIVPALAVPLVVILAARDW